MIELVENVLKTSYYLFKNKLVSGKSGNVSSRFNNLDNDILAITPAGISLSQVHSKNIALVDGEGKSLNQNKPSSELELHLKIYDSRPDINGIVHTHSPYATGFSFSDKKIKRMEGFEADSKKFLAEVPYAPPGSKELAVKVSEIIKNEEIVILSKHGVVATGKTTWEAGLRAEYVEQVAKTQFISMVLNQMKLE